MIQASVAETSGCEAAVLGGRLVGRFLNEDDLREIVQTLAQRELNDRGEIENIRIHGVRIRPGKKCYVDFSIAFAGKPVRHIYYAKVMGLRPDFSDWEVSENCGERINSSSVARIWEFPNDPRLTELPELIRARRLGEIFPRDSIGNGWNRDADLLSSVLKYVPERKCAIRIEMKSPSGRATDRELLLQLQTDGGGVSAYDVMTQLWAQQECRATDFAVPKPIFYDDTRGLLCQDWIMGEDFFGFARKDGMNTACGLAARALAGLHQSRLEGLRSLTPRQIREKIEIRTDSLTAYDGRLRPALMELRRRLYRSRLISAPRLEVPIHGDFNQSQLLFRNSKPVLVDFESVRLGDPLYDVAHFICGLHRLSVGGKLSTSVVREAISTFLRTYRNSVPWRVSDEGLRWQIAAGLLCRRAFKEMTRFEREARRKIVDYMNLAYRYLSEDKEMV